MNQTTYMKQQLNENHSIDERLDSRLLSDITKYIFQYVLNNDKPVNEEGDKLEWQ